MEFYRYEARTYANISGDDDYNRYSLPLLPNVKVELITYNLHKETPKGYWVGFGNHVFGKLRGNSIWISKTSKRRRAYPTKEEALTNFITRTKRRAKILQSQLDICLTALSIADTMVIKMSGIPTVPELNQH
jgi:hypothetical protein